MSIWTTGVTLGIVVTAIMGGPQMIHGYDEHAAQETLSSIATVEQTAQGIEGRYAPSLDSMAGGSYAPDLEGTGVVVSKLTLVKTTAGYAVAGDGGHYVAVVKVPNHDGFMLASDTVPNGEHCMSLGGSCAAKVLADAGVQAADVTWRTF